jgi:hypothetical protein
MGFEIWSSSTEYGDLYDPAMEVQTKEEADAYFKKLQDYYASRGVYPEINEKIIKVNLAYWAAYGSDERRERIERLYDCAHPHFGNISENGRPTIAEIEQLVSNRGKVGFPQTLSELRNS